MKTPWTAAAILVSATALMGAAGIDSELVRARDSQDRGTLDKLLNAARAKADHASKDAGAQFQYALTASIVAEVALEQKDKSAAEKAGLDGVKAAEAAISLNPKDPEGYRVLATLCGEVIPANIFSALSYGKRAKDAIEKAKTMAPNSAQVWIADGVGNYYLPESFGGGPDPAIRSFQRAIQLDPQSAEAWLWLGRAQRKKHLDPDARKSFEKSIALDPNRAWAKQQLEKIPGK